MSTTTNSVAPHGQRRRSILTMPSDQARAFLLEDSSYRPIDLPPYFSFHNLLTSTAEALLRTPLSSDDRKDARRHENVNHIIMHNKDGTYAWRPLELIHPALYISLVNAITEYHNWQLILQCFREFQANEHINCLSIPVQSLTHNKDTAEQIIRWWETVEQRSIELALDYRLAIHTDIVDCYAAIYTHSIAWALHTRPTAKAKRRCTTLIGNIIDAHLQDMRQGQTNGIPQGSVLMDFIAEMVLGYADTRLSEEIQCLRITDFQILRYRDDYRIFVNNTQDGEKILKCLTEVMIDLGLKLRSHKTEAHRGIIRSSIKPDKLDWMFRRQHDISLQKHLLIIHDHGLKHPNSGSLEVALHDFHTRLSKVDECELPGPLISIVVDIAYRNPRTYPISAAILSQLIDFLDTVDSKRAIVKRIRKRFSQMPNTEYVQIWLQRVSYPFDASIDFQFPLCKLVRSDDAQVWNNEWISSSSVREAISSNSIIDRSSLGAMPDVIPIGEIELFISAYS